MQVGKLVASITLISSMLVEARKVHRKYVYKSAIDKRKLPSAYIGLLTQDSVNGQYTI